LGAIALALLLIQVAVADAVFIIYSIQNNWDIPVAALSSWLGTTVVQVIGIVLVITRYLFPSQD
jgi:hypothetical protein